MDAAEFDLIIVGTGSGNSIPPAFDGWRIALIERGVFGGTCLNRGCIPSKMFVYAADVAAGVTGAGRYGVHATLEGVDWPSIVQRVFGRIDPIAAGGEDYRANRCENITVVRGSASFVDHKVLEVDGRRFTAPHILLAAGARPHLPDIAGLADVPFHTSDSVMRVADLPKRMVIVGGGYIAAELGHVFGSFGTEVTFVLRSAAMLREQDDEISQRATECYRERFDIVTGAAQMSAERRGSGVVLRGVGTDGTFELDADVLLIATGRVPNGDELAVARSGIEAEGPRVLTDEHLATNVPGVWALGDLTNTMQLKHLANAEGRIAFHNIATVGKGRVVDGSNRASLRSIDRTLVPAAVFGHPQVASVGLTEQAAQAGNIPFVVARQDYGGTAYGWAMEDSTSFCKLIVHAEARTLLGAHIIGAHASTLIQPLIQAMRFGQTVDELAHDVWYIHPALTEVVENALLQV
ncbi:MAG: mycothione reductase [Acidimicrobiia bacterium]|nr:mycothione reductase [Acidimicrobiia bacterium]